MKLIKASDQFLAMNAWVVALIGAVFVSAIAGLAGLGFQRITAYSFDMSYDPNTFGHHLVLFAAVVYVTVMATSVLTLPVLVGVRRTKVAGLKVFAAQVVLIVVLLVAVAIYYVTATNAHPFAPPYGY